MYKTITKYVEAAANNDVIIFSGSEIPNEEKFLKSVFIVNGTNNNGKASCYIENSNNEIYYLFSPVQILKSGDSFSAIMKPLPINDDDVIYFRGTEGTECSLIIDYSTQA